MPPANQQHTADATGLATPPPSTTLTKVQILANVYSLATAFATCVEAFNVIHPHKDSDHAQKVALAKLGIQQGRLLIWGDAVGISSPPATIARHMVPSHPGLTNPDPTLPVNFGVRDPRLDEDDIRKKVAAALEEITGRPAHLSREQLMERYGLKQPKRISAIEHPALDTNRLEAFREQYSLLTDLMEQSGIRPPQRRQRSIMMNHWTVKDSTRFEAFVRTVRVEVDGLIALLGVKEQVDKGMKTDIKAMAWHPELQSVIVRQDWEKLKLIREAVVDDYPEYVEVADRALQYLLEEVRGSRIHIIRTPQSAQAAPAPRCASDQEKNGAKSGAKTSAQRLPSPAAKKEKRPSSFWSFFSYRSNKSRSQSAVSAPENPNPQRSLSETGPRASEDANALEPVRSKSLPAIHDEPAPFDLNSRLAGLAGQNEEHSDSNGEAALHQVQGVEKPVASVEATLVQVPTRSTVEIHDDDVDPLDTSDSHGYNLVHADTANSLIPVDRHDMYKGVGRIDTRDIRDKSHQAAGS